MSGTYGYDLVAEMSNPVTDQSWRDGARCRGCRTDVFYPEDAGGIGQAQAICADCSVRLECLTYATLVRDEEGIFGGTTPTQRRRNYRTSQDKKTGRVTLWRRVRLGSRGDAVTVSHS